MNNKVYQWKSSKIGDLLDVTNGKTNSDDAVLDGEFPLFDRSVNIKQSNKYLFDTEALIIPGEGKEFLPRYYKGKFDLHQRAYAIFPKNGNTINLKYLFYWMYFKKDYLEKMAVGSTVKSLRLYMLQNFPVDYPDSFTQKNISDKLTLLDQEIEKTDQIIQKTEVLKKGLITDLFSVGKNLLGRKVYSMKDVCDLITDGKHGDCKNQPESGYYFVSSKDIRNGVIDYSNARQITKEDFEEADKRTQLAVGDLVMTNSGTIGRMAVVDDNSKTRSTTFQKSVAIIRPKAEITTSKYLQYYFLSVLDSIILASNGSAQKNLLLKDMRSLQIPIPTLVEQQRIVDILVMIDRKFSNETQTKTRLNKVKNGLMQDIFNRKVEVN